MARIRSFTSVKSNSATHPTETDATWSIVDADSVRLLQISTFGSDGRASDPKVSQTIQMDRDTAFALKKAIEVAFPDLASPRGVTAPAESTAPPAREPHGSTSISASPADESGAAAGLDRRASIDDLSHHAARKSLDSARDIWASRGRSDERVTPDLEMLVATVVVLAQSGEVLDTPEIRLRVIKALGVSADEFRVIRYAYTTEPEFDYRFRWAMTWAARTGYVARIRRGFYQISDEGTDLAARTPDIRAEVLNRHKEVEDRRKRRGAASEAQ